MRSLILIVFALVITATVIQPPQIAQARDRSLMLPLASELLPKPVKVKNCPITVREWRASKNQPWTGPSKTSYILLKVICERVFKDLPRFIEEEGLQMTTPDLKFHENFAFMPCNGSKDGKQYRNLNDIKSRFKKRVKFYDEMGNIQSLMGYADRNRSYVYMMNEAFHPNGKPNKKFAIVFAHELWHAISDQYGVYITLGPQKAAVDEDLARKFTKFIKLGE